MLLDDPYEKGYFPKQILEGLKFYSDVLDKIDIQIYLNPKFPIQKKDILLCIDFLSSITQSDRINRLYTSHPQLTYGMEMMPEYAKCTLQELKNSRTMVIGNLDGFLSTANNILYRKVVEEIPAKLEELSTDEKIKYLINLKHYYPQNSGSFPSKFIKDIVEHIDLVLKHVMEIKESEVPNEINAEIKKMILNYQTLTADNIKNNDFISPLLNRSFEDFITQIKKVLLVPSYHDITEDDKERIFHIYLLGVLKGRIQGYNITSNQESGIGRFDISLIPLEQQNPGVIIEIKKINSSSKVDDELEKAMTQISKNQYSTNMLNQGIKSILRIAVVFNKMEPNVRYKVDNY